MSSLYESSHFDVRVPGRPHVTRTDGGHLVIHPKVQVVNRWDFTPPLAQALMRLSMLLGQAMTLGLNERGIPLERINFQDNGNWGIHTVGGPKFHLHLYGRARGSVLQEHGQALRFPAKADAYWQRPDLLPLDENDQAAILRHLLALADSPRYALDAWGLAEG